MLINAMHSRVKMKCIQSSYKYKNRDDTGKPQLHRRLICISQDCRTKFMTPNTGRLHLWCLRKDGAIQDGECFEFWRAFTTWKWTFEEKLITLMVYLKYILNSYVKRKCYFWVYMPFKLWLVTSLLCRHFKPNATSLEMEITWGVMKLSQSKPSRTTRNSVRELTFYSIPSGWRSKYTYPRIRAKGWLQIPLNFTMSDQKS